MLLPHNCPCTSEAQKGSGVEKRAKAQAEVPATFARAQLYDGASDRSGVERFRRGRATARCGVQGRGAACVRVRMSARGWRQVAGPRGDYGRT